jgi:hypothetical protein
MILRLKLAWGSHRNIELATQLALSDGSAEACTVDSTIRPATISEPTVGPPRPRSVRGRQHLTEGVVQFAAADLALEHLVTAVVVLPLLGVDEAGSPLRREELNAC